MSEIDLSVVLLHEGMVDKHGKLVTTSLTLNDIQDLARSSRTYGITTLFIAHPGPALQKLARTLLYHWEKGFGSTYNPNRKEAMERVNVVSTLDDAIMKIELRTKKLPILISTSAKPGDRRIGFKECRELIRDGQPYLLMLGSGWGMADPLLNRAQYILEPINGPTEFNHLSVRSACAIMLDRLLAE